MADGMWHRMLHYTACKGTGSTWLIIAITFELEAVALFLLQQQGPWTRPWPMVDIHRGDMAMESGTNIFVLQKKFMMR